MSSVALHRARGRLSQTLRDRTAFLIGLIVVTAGAMSLISPYFLNLDNLLGMTQFGAVIGLLALGQTLVIIGGGGGIDISVGSRACCTNPRRVCGAVWSFPGENPL